MPRKARASSFPQTIPARAQLQPIGLQTRASLMRKNQKAEEAAFVGLLMKVAAVLVL
jgi:hypothetical protein